MDANKLLIPYRQRPLRPAGFTIVELLTVITIISLLITIMVPSIMQAKAVARSAKTRGLLHAMDTGLEMFHSDEQYPPSEWKTQANVAEGHPGGDPYLGGGNYTAFGAETLVWALAGADLQGTAGFDPPAGKTLANLYELNATTKKPNYYRAGPFLDTSKAEIDTKFSVTVSASSGSLREASVFLDAFNTAVIYYRADPRKADPRQIYIRDDNHGFIRNSPLVNDPATDNFDTFIQNLKMTSSYRPHNSDTYLLVSPGLDTLYGTKDDVTNFPLTRDNYLSAE